MEKLPDAVGLALAADGVELREGGAHEARAGGQVARQAERAHAAAVGLQRHVRSKGILRLSRRQMHIVVQREELLRERWVIRQHADRIFVNLQPRGRRLQREGAGRVREQPVQLGGREVQAERRSRQVDGLQQLPGLRQRGALPQQPRNEFELRHVLPPVLRRGIAGVADEVQPGNAEAFFVHGIVIQRIAVRHMGRAENGIALLRAAAVAEAEREPAGKHDDLLAIGCLIIQRAAHIELTRLIGDCSAHNTS